MTCIIVFSLVLINIVLFVAYSCKLDDDACQLKKLVDEKKANNEPYNEEELKEDIEPKLRYMLICGIVACLDIWIVVVSFIHWLAGDGNAISLKDCLGAVDSLISMLAFAGMVVTIAFQHKELCLQRKELKAQRAESSQQNKTLALQRFENTFFNMLELQQKIVNDLSTENADLNKNITGRRLFRYAFEECEHYIKSSKETISGLGNVMNLYGFSEYDRYYTSTYFDHYFRHFYRILKFMKQNETLLSLEKQYKYTSMLRGTLSRYELVWLFYNGLSGNGRDKLKPLLEDYSMLKNLRTDLLTLCKGNRDKLREAGVSEDGITDYEFALSDKKGTNNYYIGAFYSKEDLQGGIEHYERWKSFCEKKGISMEWELK